MKQIFLLTFLILSSYLSAQSPVTIPYPEMQFYRVPAFKEIVDNELDSICQYWYNSTDNEWRRIYKCEFQYNNKGLLTKSIKWNWRYDEKYWKGESKIDFFYQNEKLIGSVEYMWWNDSANWVKKYKNEYEYNLDTIIEIQYYNYIETSNLKKTQKRKFYYNKNWKIKEEIIFDWYVSYNKFTEWKKMTYEYDNNNRLIEYIDYWHFVDWEYDSKDIYVFNDDSSTMENIGFEWKNDSWEENWRTKDNFIYENNHLNKLIRHGQTCWPALDSCAFTVMNTYDFKYENERLVERIRYFSTGRYDEKIECFYSEKTLGIEGNSNEKYDIRVYPNPAHDYLIISGQNIRQINVYTINGILVYSKKNVYGNEDVRIDISTMNKGLYLFQTITKNGIEIRRKIIKQ